MWKGEREHEERLWWHGRREERWRQGSSERRKGERLRDEEGRAGQVGEGEMGRKGERRMELLG